MERCRGCLFEERDPASHPFCPDQLLPDARAKLKGLRAEYTMLIPRTARPKPMDFHPDFRLFQPGASGPSIAAWLLSNLDLTPWLLGEGVWGRGFPRHPAITSSFNKQSAQQASGGSRCDRARGRQPAGDTPAWIAYCT